MPSFADGFLAGSAGVRNVIGTGIAVRDAMYQGKLQDDALDRLKVEKDDRDFQVGLRDAMKAAAMAPQPNQLEGNVSGMDMAADGTTGPKDERPLWQVQADAYKAGADYAAKNGRLEAAAELVHGAASTRVRAATEQAQSGLRDWMTTGDGTSLLRAFNTIDDGTKGKSITTNPDGTVSLTFDQGGKTQEMRVTKDQLPQLVSQYFDPAGAYQRQAQSYAERLKEQFKTDEKIRGDVAVETAKVRGQSALKEQERTGQMPKIEQLDQGEGVAKRAVLIAPNQEGGYDIKGLDGSAAGGPTVPRLSKQDAAMHDDIRTSAWQGVANGMMPVTDDVKAKTDARIGTAQSLYDANRNNPNVGAMNESHWLALADAVRTGQAGKVQTRQSPDGRQVQTVTYKGITYSLDPDIPGQGTGPAAASGRPSARAPISTSTGARIGGTAPVAPPSPQYPKVSAEQQRARDSDRMSILGDELAETQAKLAALPADAPASDRARLQGDIASIQREMGGTQQRATARTASPPTGAPAAASPVTTARNPSNTPPAAAPVVAAPTASSTNPPPSPKPAAAITRPTDSTPQGRAPAPSPRQVDSGSAATIERSPEAVAKDTRRLAQVNAELALQARGVVSGARPSLDPALVEERDALKDRLNRVGQASEDEARASRSARERAAGRSAGIGGATVSLR